MKILFTLTLRQILIIFLFLGFINGCVSNNIKYPNNHKKNLTIKTSIKGESFFKDINAYLHISKLDAQCKSKYLGTVKLDKPVKKVGLPVNQKLFLEFVFGITGGGSGSRLDMDTIITPRKGHTFYADMFYEDDIYDIMLWRNKSRKYKKRKIKPAHFDSCKKSK